MSTSTQVHVHRDDPDTVGRRERLGVILLLVADIAFVLCLIFSYLYLRLLNVNGMWLPEDVTPAVSGRTWFVTIALVAAAVIFGLGVRSYRAGNAAMLVIAAAVTFLISIAAVVLQYMQLTDLNFPQADNGYMSAAYSSSILALGWANMFHILLAVIISFGILNRARLGRYEGRDAWQPRLVAYWWAWVAVSAILVALVTTFLVGSPYPPSMS